MLTIVKPLQDQKVGVTSKRVGATSKKDGVTSKRVEASSKKVGVNSSKVGANSNKDGVIFNKDVLRSRLKHESELHSLGTAKTKTNLKDLEELNNFYGNFYQDKSFKVTDLDRCRLRVRVFLNGNLFGEDTSQVI